MSKKYILSSGKVNRYKYRVLVSGARLENFKKNPVILAYHNGNNLPVGKMTELEIVGDQLLGVPVFDQDDEYAMKIAKKYENGYMNTFSIRLEPIEVSDDQSLKLEGQERVTVVDWELLEVSAVSLPGDPGAHALTAYDKDGIDAIIPKLNLNKINNNIMELNTEQKALRVQLGLKEDATDKEVNDAVQAMKDAQQSSLNANIESLLSLGKSKGFITDDNESTYKELALSNFNHVKKLIDDAPVKKEEEGLSMEELLTLNKKNNPADPVDDKESFEYLSKNDPDKLNKLRVEDPVKYKELALAYSK